MERSMKPHWMLTHSSKVSFTYAAYITVFGLLLALLLTVLGETFFSNTQAFRIPTFFGLLSIGVAAVLLAAGLYLWLGMIFFLLKFDQRSLISKCALMPLFLLGTTVTATLYYFLVYREASRGGGPSPMASNS